MRPLEREATLGSANSPFRDPHHRTGCRASGVTYYGTIAAMKGANSLWVEACALGCFFCSGKV